MRKDRAVVLESRDSCDIARIMSPGLDKRGAQVKVEEKVANSFVVFEMGKLEEEQVWGPGSG